MEPIDAVLEESDHSDNEYLNERLSDESSDEETSALVKELTAAPFPAEEETTEESLPSTPISAIPKKLTPAQAKAAKAAEMKLKRQQAKDLKEKGAAAAAAKEKAAAKGKQLAAKKSPGTKPSSSRTKKPSAIAAAVAEEDGELKAAGKDTQQTRLNKDRDFSQIPLIQKFFKNPSTRDAMISCAQSYQGSSSGSSPSGGSPSVGSPSVGSPQVKSAVRSPASSPKGSPLRRGNFRMDDVDLDALILGRKNIVQHAQGVQGNVSDADINGPTPPASPSPPASAPPMHTFTITTTPPVSATATATTTTATATATATGAISQSNCNENSNATADRKRKRAHIPSKTSQKSEAWELAEGYEERIDTLVEEFFVSNWDRCDDDWIDMILPELVPDYYNVQRGNPKVRKAFISKFKARFIRFKEKLEKQYISHGKQNHAKREDKFEQDEEGNTVVVTPVQQMVKEKTSLVPQFVRKIYGRVGTASELYWYATRPWVKLITACDDKEKKVAALLTEELERQQRQQAAGINNNNNNDNDNDDDINNNNKKKPNNNNNKK